MNKSLNACQFKKKLDSDNIKVYLFDNSGSTKNSGSFELETTLPNLTTSSFDLTILNINQIKSLLLSGYDVHICIQSSGSIVLYFVSTKISDGRLSYVLGTDTKTSWFKAKE